MNFLERLLAKETLNPETALNYYPFGSLMPGRLYTSTNYRYGFNNKEKDDEVKGNGNQIDYGFRIFDPRLGKFLSVDPLTKKYPWYTPYQFAGNTPIQAKDVDGLEPAYTIYNKNTGMPLFVSIPSSTIQARVSTNANFGIALNQETHFGENLSTGGKIVSWTGVVALTIPGMEEFGPPLILTGSRMKNAGTALTLADDYNKGNRTAFIVDAVGAYAGTKVDSKVSQVITNEVKKEAVKLIADEAVDRVQDKFKEVLKPEVIESPSENVENLKPFPMLSLPSDKTTVTKPIDNTIIQKKDVKK